MKILFLTDNFPPESNAPATRTFEHCSIWVKEGAEVTVITGVPNFPKGKVYEGYKNKLYQTEYIKGIKVIRVWTFIAANKGFLKRTLDFLSFMMSSFWVGLFVKTDLIVATSPQFFTAVSGRWLAFWKRRKWIMEVRDIWPESIKAVGAMKTNSILRFFEFLEGSMYKSAHRIIVVTDSFKHLLTSKHNIEGEKIRVIKNGINTDMFFPMPKNQSLLANLGLENKFIIGYIGTHGMAHNLSFILDSAAQIKDDEVHFLFLGTGAEKENLLARMKKLGLNNISMLDAVPKKMVKEYISILDVGLVNLKKSDTFKSVIPSKIFELAAMHKPILLGVEGEAKAIIEEYKIGIPFEPGNDTDFIESVHAIKKGETRIWGFDKLVKDFDRTDLAKRMLKILRSR